MDNFVVADWQDEVFRKSVVQPKCHLVMMIFAMNWVLLQVGQRVVHPPHVPLEAKAQTIVVSRSADARKGRRFLGDRHDAWHFAIAGFVHLFEELNGFQIFASTVDVGDPLALFAGIIAVQHGRHGIDAQAVYMVLL